MKAALDRELPEAIADLGALALDMRWSWNHAADALWQRISPELWERTGNPWFILENVSQESLRALAGTRDFVDELGEQSRARAAYLARETWFASAEGAGELKSVAYFSMEFGLSEALPVYSGGLGILAGDYLKTASDLGIPAVGVGLLYQQGYFRQVLNARSEQVAFYPYNDPSLMPLAPVRDAAGERVHVKVELPGRAVYLRAWQVQVGRVTLYLLDSNNPLNSPADRGITSELYGGGPEVRLQQEIVLGVGGWRLLGKLGTEPQICHLNEGHAAFAPLERARSFMAKAGVSFERAMSCTRVGNVFTTHTPVPAAFDRFAPELFGQYAGTYAALLGIGAGRLMGLGRVNPQDDREPFNMAYLAARSAGAINAVSHLHGQVSRRIFRALFPRWPEAEVPITHVTNGVHVPSWDSEAADDLWTASCGKGRWLGTLETLSESVCCLTDAELWQFRSRQRQALVEAIRRRLALQRVLSGENHGEEAPPGPLALDANVLTLGFARRFTGYKRPNLLLFDKARLSAILNNHERPVQLLVAGKAHPEDEEGRQVVREWAEYARQPEVRARVFFLEDYDMSLAIELVTGVDVWINTPRRPWEACGTSGMKLLVNGGLNLSELDGWWAEAYSPEVGWALGDGAEHDDAAWDAREARELYELLERQVIPEFYDRDLEGLPRAWIARIRASMSQLAPRFSSNRMLREYAENIYLPAARALARRLAQGARLAGELEKWQRRLAQGWANVHFGPLHVESTEHRHEFRLPVYLGDVAPADVKVELYADTVEAGQQPVRVAMDRVSEIPGTLNGYLYQATVANQRPADYYTPRVVPYHPEARVPLEEAHILWLR